MKSMFDPISLGGLQLGNRLIRSATVERMCDEEGRLTERLARCYEELAEGQVGLIITGMMGVMRNSCVRTVMARAYDPDFVPALRKITEAVQARGGKIVVQLSHCGVKAAVLEDGGQPAGASEIELEAGKPARAMSREELAAVARAFGESARRCKEGGADGVQLHCAHGYMLSQFLSPFFNKRTDEYGGNIENRARIVFESYAAVRAAVGPDYPVLIKINFSDLAEPSITAEECAWVCSELAKRGLTAVELSAGLGNNKTTSPIRRIGAAESDEGYFFEAASVLATGLDIPVLTVGGYRSPAVIEAVLNKSGLAGVSLCRPFISEPGLVRRWKNGDLRKARCISCNKCFSSGPISCPTFNPA